MKIFTMVTSTILFAVLLSQYIRIDTSHESKIEIFEAESEKIFKQIGTTTIEIYIKEMEHISDMVNKIFNFFILLDKTDLHPPETADTLKITRYIEDAPKCGSLVDYIYQLHQESSLLVYNFIDLNTENRTCLPCQVFSSAQDQNSECKHFRVLHFEDPDTHQYYSEKFGKYSRYFYNMFYLNQFYELWNNATGIKKKFDFFKLFRFRWYIKHLFETYLKEKSHTEYVLFLVGIVKMAVDTSQNQYVVTSFPSSEFSEFTSIDKEFFDLRNGIKLLKVDSDSKKSIDLILNLDLNDKNRLFLMFDFYNISKNLLNTFEGFDLSVDETKEVEITNNKVVFEDFDASPESFQTEKENDNDYTILRIKKQVRLFNRIITLEYSRRFQSRLKSKRFFLMNYIASQLILPTILFIYIFLQLHIIQSLFIQRVFLLLQLFSLFFALLLLQIFLFLCECLQVSFFSEIILQLSIQTSKKPYIS